LLHPVDEQGAGADESFGQELWIEGGDPEAQQSLDAPRRCPGHPDPGQMRDFPCLGLRGRYLAESIGISATADRRLLPQ
jgi:hypothetical protein